MTNSDRGRIWFLDCVRYWSVLAVVVLHVSYMTVVVLVQFALWAWSGLPGPTVLVAGVVLSLLGTHLLCVVVGWVQTTATSSMREVLSKEQFPAELEAE